MQFLRTLLFSFFWRYLLFHCSRQCVSKYHLTNSMRRALPNRYMTRNVELCETNTQVTWKFLRTLPFSFYLKIFPFSLYPSIRSEISLYRFHQKSVRKQLHEQKGGTLWDKLRDQKDMYQISSFSFLSLDISFGCLLLQISEISVLRFNKNWTSKQLHEIQL